MTTPQNSYRELADGEIMREWDFYEPGVFIPSYLWVKPRQKLGSKVFRPIHRQPDGSWRDEGEEPKPLDTRKLHSLCGNLYSALENANRGTRSLVHLKVCLDDYVCEVERLIPLEPEQEEWEKAYDDYIQQMSRESVLPQDRCSKENFKVWHDFFQRQAHERKQGEKK